MLLDHRNRALGKLPQFGNVTIAGIPVVSGEPSTLSFLERVTNLFDVS